MRYAGFWRRFTAYGIDASIVQFIMFLLLLLLAPAAHAGTEDSIRMLIDMGWLPEPESGQSISDVLKRSGASGEPLFGLSDFFITLMFSGIYHIWFTASSWQATPGKRLCKIKVIMANGSKLSLGMSAARWFACLVSWLPLGFGFLMIGFTKEKIAMHDAICGTRVIYRQ